jgi:putative phosphoribosyl transferase
MQFQNRSEAGRLLAARLTAYAHRADVAVVALTRGGVPVGYEIARALHVPLDVLVVRKLGVPGNPEFAMGAIASGDVVLLDENVVRMLEITQGEIDAVIAEKRLELERQEKLYHGCREPLTMQGRQIILTDDGLATGWTMRAAILALRWQRPARIVVAVPVAAPSTFEEIQAEGDEAVCLSTPASFHAVGQFYREFPQIPDDRICDFLGAAKTGFVSPSSRKECG